MVLVEEIQVLLVEDDEIDAESVMRQLDKQDATYATKHVTCLANALACVKDYMFQVVLLDMGLPDSTELEGVIRLREEAPHLPILVLTGLDDQTKATQAVRAGAQDYLIKGKIGEDVLARSIRYAIDRQKIQNEALEHLEALEASEFRFRRLYEAMFEGMIIHDGECVIDVNDQFASMFGYEVEDLVGRSIYDLLNADSGHVVREHIENRIEDLYETIGRRQNGELFPIEIVARNMISDGTDIRVAVVRDVTERRESLAQIRKLSRAVEQSANMVIVTDNQGIIEYVNPKFCTVTGYSRKEVIGKKPSIVKSDMIPLEVYQDLWQTISSGDTWQGELLNQTKSGVLFWVSTSIAPVRDEREEITNYVAIQEDVTQQKLTQEALAELNETLENRVETRTQELSEINKELETFSYSVSHDLQAPLRSIMGFSQILLEDHAGQLNEDGRDCLKRVGAATKKMTHLIEDILAYSRQTRGELTCEDVDLSRLAQDIFKDLQEQHPHREGICEIENGLVSYGDKRMLRVMLVNLLSNAWKFTRERCPARIEFGKTIQSGSDVYFVRDNGAGFDIKHAQTIFDPFRRLHNATKFEGSGIGLSTVQRIIRRHGGWVWAEAKVDVGATFYFTLNMNEIQRDESALV